jgi:hypothetical protein
MADWFLNLPVLWMALIVFVATSLIVGGVYLVDHARRNRVGTSLQGGITWLVTGAGRSFCAIGRIHRGQGLE